MRKNKTGIWDMPFDELFDFKVDTNELKVLAGVSQDILPFMAKYTRSRKSPNYQKIRQESRARIRLRASYFPEVFSVSKNFVKAWTRSLGLTAVPGLYSDLDLERNKYEGGFKVWEGTCDLIKFLTQDDDILRNLMDRESTLRVLELGAGSGLASLALMSRLIDDPDFKSNYRIHLQDYNWEVLCSLTLLNFTANLPRKYLDSLLETGSLRFFYGDWAVFRGKKNYKYDLIMMSEVTYNSDNYDSLHNLLERHLRETGYVIMATKDTYFGLDGGLYSWLDYMEAKDVFVSYKIIQIPDTSIPRTIIVLNRKSLNV